MFLALCIVAWYHVIFHHITWPFSLVLLILPLILKIPYHAHQYNPLFSFRLNIPTKITKNEPYFPRVFLYTSMYSVYSLSIYVDWSYAKLHSLSCYVYSTLNVFHCVYIGIHLSQKYTIIFRRRKSLPGMISILLGFFILI